MNKDITSMDIAELEALVAEMGQPKFRAKQLHEWIHGKCVASYDEMTNLPKDFRAKLTEIYPLENISIVNTAVSKDGTRKYLFELNDGCVIESVGILSGSIETEAISDLRLTVCVSTQVGCPIGCVFCATGQQGFTRNLTANEIVQQVALVGSDFDKRVDNVVFMGQGEPFLNYDAVIDAMRRLNTDSGLNIGARHITVSTSGIINRIESLSEEPEQFRLAISLHSAVQRTRDVIMPNMRKHPLSALKAALKNYSQNKDRRITLEYLLLDGINDSDQELEALINFCKGLKVHVNLLPYNSTDGSYFEASPQYIVSTWLNTLENCGIPTSYRRSKGSDIAGACGQLANKVN